MRISDWSSDVCSSDLLAAQFNGIGGLVNGGEATSEGLELAALFRPTDRLQLGLNAAYTDATVQNDFAATVIPQPGFDVVLNTGLAGARMPYSPKLAWAATAEYLFAVGSMRGPVGAGDTRDGGRGSAPTEHQRVTGPGGAPT